MKLKSYFVLYSGQVLQNHNENSNKNIVIPFFSFMKKTPTRISNIFHHLTIYLSLTFSSAGLIFKYKRWNI